MRKQPAMNKILLATDFSETSRKAGAFAVTLAQAFGADLHIMHVLETTVYKTVMPEIDLLSFSESPVSKAVENRLTQYSEEVTGGSGVNVTSHFQLGTVSDLVVEAARQIDCGLVITGSHGASGIKERFAGTNAYRIATQCEAPVLSIPENANTSIKRILVPIDETLSTLEKIPWAGLFADKLKATVHVLGVLKQGDHMQHDVVKGHLETAQRYLADLSVQSNHFYEEGDNYAEVVKDFVKKSGAEMVCIMTDRKKSATGIFPGNFAHQIMNESKVPVFSMHPGVR